MRDRRPVSHYVAGAPPPARRLTPQCSRCGRYLSDVEADRLAADLEDGARSAAPSGFPLDSLIREICGCTPRYEEG